MKLPVPCAQCMQEDIANAGTISVVTFKDDGRYEVVCPRGHVSTILLQQEKFEVLFEIGAYAIRDGYYREAVSSFMSALERFYEYFVKVVCLSKNIDWDQTATTWKEISSQSERQLGAFIFVYYLEFLTKPTLLKNASVAFRNGVVHKGKIPTKAESITYGQEILDLIRPTIKALKERHTDTVHKAVFYHLRNTRTQADDDRAVATMSIGTILGLSIDDEDHHSKSLEEAIQRMRK